MWAYRLEGPMRFVCHEVPEPEESSLADGDVLVRFAAGGVCGSDLPRCRDGIGGPGPEPFGRSLHEVVGTVVATRADLPVGARVVGWVSDLCGLREQVPTNASELLPLDDALDDVHAVPLQPLACVLHALSRLPDITGARAAVIGLGPIGVLFAHALKDRGATEVVGVDMVDRSAIAGDFGLDRVARATSHTWARADEQRDAFDLVVEAIGHQVGTLDDAITVAAPDGTILYFGNPDDLYYPVRFGTLMDKNLVLRAGRTPRDQRRGALRRAVEYVERYPLLPERYVTDVLPVHQAQTAFEMASRPRSGQLKIILNANA